MQTALTTYIFLTGWGFPGAVCWSFFFWWTQTWWTGPVLCPDIIAASSLFPGSGSGMLSLQLLLSSFTQLCICSPSYQVFMFSKSSPLPLWGFHPSVDWAQPPETTWVMWLSQEDLQDECIPNKLWSQCMHCIHYSTFGNCLWEGVRMFISSLISC